MRQRAGQRDRQRDRAGGAARCREGCLHTLRLLAVQGFDAAESALVLLLDLRRRELTLTHVRDVLQHLLLQLRDLAGLNRQLVLQLFHLFLSPLYLSHRRVPLALNPLVLCLQRRIVPLQAIDAPLELGDPLRLLFHRHTALHGAPRSALSRPWPTLAPPQLLVVCVSLGRSASIQPGHSAYQVSDIHPDQRSMNMKPSAQFVNPTQASSDA